MKCVKNNNEVRRVSDAVATELVAKGWSFCGKQEWKKAVRDVKKPEPKAEVTETAPKEPKAEKKTKKSKKA